jgi:hypothetical protein
MAFRRLKQTVRSLLAAENFDAALEALGAYSERQVINPLFGLLYESDPLTRWRAITAIGRVVAGLADRNPESARVVMRRLMWTLNDESGGIGWGSPEAMGEIMACHTRMAHEYAHILISYLNPEGNYLEYEELQRGVLWALGRLARVHPELTAPARPFMTAFLSALHPELRGLALWAGTPLADVHLRAHITPLRDDPAELTIYEGGRLRAYTISELAQAVLDRGCVGG